MQSIIPYSRCTQSYLPTRSNRMLFLKWQGTKPMEIDDLCTQQELTDEKLLDTLEARYQNGQIYTNSGLFLISINPYTDIDLYGKAVEQLYKRGVADLKPHVFSLINTCIADSKAYGQHSVIITGDSGSGKTETAKRMLEYLDVEEMKQVDVLLEALGNAKTENNSNSSRFGKMIHLDGYAAIEAILLERSRVTNAAEGENFHVFYAILNSKGISLFNDYIKHRAAPEGFVSYGQFKEAAECVGVEFEFIERILLGILYLGSLQITDGKIVYFPEYEDMLEYLALSKESFEFLLTKKTLVVCGESIHRDYSEKESYMIRDSIARLLYASVFEYVLVKINDFLRKKRIQISNLNILDIYGFENFQKNGLEQFCINWCNERIYDGFVRETVENQEMILEEEGVSRRSEYRMPSSSLEFIERRCGIADLAGEEALLGGTAESLGVKIEKQLNIQMASANTMPYKHFGGTVLYDLADFIKKNREKCNISEVYANASSGDSAQSTFILGHLVPLSPQCSSVNLIHSFREDLDRLFAFLNASRVKYIRCIKPNKSQLPLVFDRDVVSQQLESSGVLQSVEISKHLYPYFMFIDEFEERYSQIRDVIKDDMVVVGKTRCFFNNSVFKFLENSRTSYISNCAKRISSFLMTYLEMDRNKPESAKAEPRDEETIPDITQEGEHKKEDTRCKNCELLQQKYKIQSQELQRMQALRKELAECKMRLKEYEDDDSSTYERASIYNIFGCFIQLYLDYLPIFSDRDIPKDEILSMAHGIIFILGLLDASAFSQNLEVCIDEIQKRLGEFEKNASKVAFILSNLIELRICLNGVTATLGHSLEQLDSLVSILFSHLCVLQRQSLDSLLPSTVIEYQHLKEFKVRESIYKKIFSVPSISKLILSLEHIYNMNTYYYLPDTFIINNLSYLLSYIDFVSFNSLLVKKKFLNHNRSIQINYNLSEIEKFCKGIGFSQGMYNMAYMKEGVRVALEVVRGETEPAETAENTFLSYEQLSSMFAVFGAEQRSKADCSTRFIDEPQVVHPGTSNMSSNLTFVQPKYLPERSLRSIMKIIEQTN